MRYLIAIFSLITLILTSCRADFDFERSNGELRFSKDTVYLDTVFTNIGSSTYTLKVYNKSNKNIAIPKIQLEKGATSKYRLMVDGMPGKQFENVELLAKDSMFIFVEVTAAAIDANPSDFLYTDKILFGEGTGIQKVELVTLIQDAIFIYPQRTPISDTAYDYESINLGTDANGNPVKIKASILSENDPVNGNELLWTNQKPYVIYGYAIVPSNKTLVVNAGARVHFHDQSGIIVAQNGSLHINGTSSTTSTMENEVIFEGDRLEPNFSGVAGQWGTIWLSQGSTNNKISNLTLKNATAGLLITGNDGSNLPTLTLKNTQIYNCSNVGILARTASMKGENIVVSNCGQTSLACTMGGKYDFTHCTFANYWSSPNQNCMVLDDYYETQSGITTVDLQQASFKNCIFYGSSNLSIKLTQKGNVYNYDFKNCLIKFFNPSTQLSSNPLYQFDSLAYSACLVAYNSTQSKPDFKNTAKNDFRIGANSAAKGTANFMYSSGTSDLKNSVRNNPSDIGAYNWITFD